MAVAHLAKSDKKSLCNDDALYNGNGRALRH